MSDRHSDQESSSETASSAASTCSVGTSSPWARPPRVEVPSPPPEDDNYHPLLEKPTPIYSHLALKRGIVTWAHLKNSSLRAVVDYYQRLEALEETMSPEERAANSQSEEELLTSPPPTSEFFEEHFGHIYQQPPNTACIKAAREAAVACNDDVAAAALSAAMFSPAPTSHPAL